MGRYQRFFRRAKWLGRRMLRAYLRLSCWPLWISIEGIGLYSQLGGEALSPLRLQLKGRPKRGKNFAKLLKPQGLKMFLLNFGIMETLLTMPAMTVWQI